MLQERPQVAPQHNSTQSPSGPEPILPFTLTAWTVDLTGPAGIRAAVDEFSLMFKRFQPRRAAQVAVALTARH